MNAKDGLLTLILCVAHTTGQAADWRFDDWALLADEQVQAKARAVLDSKSSRQQDRARPLFVVGAGLMQRGKLDEARTALVVCIQSSSSLTLTESALAWLIGAGETKLAQSLFRQDKRLSALPNLKFMCDLFAPGSPDAGRLQNSSKTDFKETSSPGGSSRYQLLADAVASERGRDHATASTKIEAFLRAEPASPLSALAYGLQAEWLHRLGKNPQRAYGSAMMSYLLACPKTPQQLRSGEIAIQQAILHGHFTVALAISLELKDAGLQSELSRMLYAYSALSLGQDRKARETLATTAKAGGLANLIREVVLARLKAFDGDYRRAVDQLRHLAVQSDTAFVKLDLAMYLATCPDAKVRNGREAIGVLYSVQGDVGNVERWHALLAYAYAETQQQERASVSLTRWETLRGARVLAFRPLAKAIRARQGVMLAPSRRLTFRDTHDALPVAFSSVRRSAQLILDASTNLENDEAEKEYSHVAAKITQSQAELVLGNRDRADRLIRESGSLAKELYEREAVVHTLVHQRLRLREGIPPSERVKAWVPGTASQSLQHALALIDVFKSVSETPALRKTALNRSLTTVKATLKSRSDSYCRNDHLMADLARVRFELRDFSKARALIDQALTNYRVHEDAFASETWLLRAQILARSGDARLALQNAIVAWRLRPETRGLDETLSLIHLKLGNWQAARFWTDRAMARMKDQPNAITRLLLRRSEINRHSKASSKTTVIAASATSGPNSVANADGLANAEGSRRTGVSTKSVGSANAGLGTKSRVLTNGSSAADTGDLPQADIDLQTALARLPQQLRSWDDHHTAWLVHVYAANVALRQGDEATAKRHLQLAVQTEIENPAAVLSLIGLLTTARQTDLRAPDQAAVLLRQWQNRLGLDERFTIAQACLTASRGDFDSAIRQLKFSRTLADDKSPAAKQMDHLLEHFQKRQLPTVIPTDNVFFEAE